MHHHDPQFTRTLELVEHVHGLTAEQADAILRTIPDECRLTAPAAIRLLSGREPTAHDHLTAALLVNARQVGCSPATLLELQADLVGIWCPA